MNLIKDNFKDDIGQIYKNHIYEDLMIAIVLHEYNINPIKINNIIIGDK